VDRTGSQWTLRQADRLSHIENVADVAGRHGGLEIDYPAFQGGRPSQVVLRGPDLDLALALNQVEMNADLPRDQLVALKIPEGVAPLSLDELRKAGPLGQ
jgi:hypothetical protein